MNCTIEHSVGYVQCGVHRLSATEFLDTYLRFRGGEASRSKSRPDGMIGTTMADFIGHIRKEAKDISIVAAFMQPELKYKQRRAHPAEEVAKRFGFALLAALVWWLLGMGLYQLLLYILHGHARIARS